MYFANISFKNIITSSIDQNAKLKWFTASISYLIALSLRPDNNSQL